MINVTQRDSEGVEKMRHPEARGAGGRAGRKAPESLEDVLCLERKPLTSCWARWG
jgi:hypothetical protein